eukprot:CAMPEP_0194029926 /NCGR_PEP_ID=MMETSP0009_2-20130614/3552_1 /TAXON_ID=210454 /ORGANISM="Grammatophora oceanica, Strain CCMP 410" /LENGTH=161 /DNA_ID=CAMNT_0038669749 /DNA_START=10 /DNA_END=495 /DNA_ORIENTATION=-
MNILKIIKKFGAWGSKPDVNTFPELTQCVIWLRFIIAIGYGTYLGLSDSNRAIAVMFGLNAVTFVPLIYCHVLLQAEMESFSGLTFGGLVNALALIILIWVGIHSWKHEDELSELTASIITQAAKSAAASMVGDDDTTLEDATTATETMDEVVAEQPDSEF